MMPKSREAYPTSITGRQSAAIALVKAGLSERLGNVYGRQVANRGGYLVREGLGGTTLENKGALFL
ncbi:MAG: hypothetical protein P8020_12170 [Acidobacteriota bacterium]|jgi:hypothetical protein